MLMFFYVYLYCMGASIVRISGIVLCGPVALVNYCQKELLVIYGNDANYDYLN